MRIPAASRSATTPARAYAQAHRTDPTSAYGGVIAFNRPLDEAAAEAIVERQFAEVIVAPEIDRSARSRRCASKPAIRVLEPAMAAGRGPRRSGDQAASTAASCSSSATSAASDVATATVVTRRAADRRGARAICSSPGRS